MAPLDLNLSTSIILVILAILAFLSARRMFRKGTCDCHKDNPRGKQRSQNSACSGCSCSCCVSCPSAEALSQCLDELVEKKQP